MALPADVVLCEALILVPGCLAPLQSDSRKEPQEIILEFFKLL